MCLQLERQTVCSQDNDKPVIFCLQKDCLFPKYLHQELCLWKKNKISSWAVPCLELPSLGCWLCSPSSSQSKKKQIQFSVREWGLGSKPWSGQRCKYVNRKPFGLLEISDIATNFSRPVNHQNQPDARVQLSLRCWHPCSGGWVETTAALSGAIRGPTLLSSLMAAEKYPKINCPRDVHWIRNLRKPEERMAETSPSHLKFHPIWKLSFYPVIKVSIKLNYF